MTASMLQWVRLAPGTNACLLPDGYEVRKVLQREMRLEGIGTATVEWQLLELVPVAPPEAKP